MVIQMITNGPSLASMVNTSQIFRFWNFLLALAKNASYPWIFMGDSNEILHRFYITGLVYNRLKQIRNFKQVIKQRQLLDIGYYSPDFTWRRANQFLECLDRGLATPTWKNMFPRVVIHHLPFLTS